jgi:hypothetical protein
MSEFLRDWAAFSRKRIHLQLLNWALFGFAL